ncbi:MAG TPA: methionine--tRNA ligase [Phycisphaerae bacterium]|nr:methionine--tRNA ligase [Phycisphaerae bacterium]
MSNTFYVTTPIYYVNDAPHIGHSYTTIAADVLARYNRTAGRDVYFLTGTDEHGIKMVKAASEKTLSPKELADINAPHFKSLWEELNITNSDFIRTTQPRHIKRVQEMVRRLVDRGEIFLGKYEGWYDEGQEEYVTETTAKENDYKSAINGKPLVKYSEENWFFRLTKWTPKLIAHIEANPDFIQPAARRNEVLSKLRIGVDDLCVSRRKEKLPWGIEMPNDNNHVVYVWIDALSNYINALGLIEVGDEYDGKFAKYWPASVHLIGKDILWFHAVYWPCILMALDIPLPKTVFAHGWWTSNGRKMSKSLGNFVNRETIEKYCLDYHRDVYRYYLLRAVTFGGDGDFSADMFKQIYNTELANGVGNLLSRTIKMISKYFDGRIPAAGPAVEQAAAVEKAATELTQIADELMAHCAFSKYTDNVMALVTATNTFIDQTEPFRLAKDESQKPRLATIMNTCAQAVRIVLQYLAPFMPEKTAQGLATLGCRTGELGKFGELPAGTAVNPGEPLFMRKQ